MDHNLDDSLTLDSAMGVDFEHSESAVVGQADISLGTCSHDEGMPMEFEHIEEEQILMDTGNEEIIDFMGEQLTLQEYSVHDNQITGDTTTVESNQENALVSLPEAMLDLQFEPQSISVPAASGMITQEVQMHPKVITVKAAVPLHSVPKKDTVAVMKAVPPREVAIAPKPPKLVQANFQKLNQKAVFAPKQYAIAPKPAKPVTLMANRSMSLVKKVSVAGSMQTNVKGNTVLAQIGKQLVMVPASGSQKIKLVAGPGVPTVRLLGTTDSDQAQLISTQKIHGSQAPKMTKVIVQGQSNVDMANQPAVITKILPVSGSGQAQTRYVMQQKTVPITMGSNQLLLTSPKKQTVRLNNKQQIIAIKSPSQKLLPATTAQGMSTKKVVITAKPTQQLSTQKVILKATMPSTTGQINKSGNTVPRTQLHQVNVPGKGIQYIRLMTNPSQTASKSPAKTQVVTTSSQTFVLTDSKGNFIQMSTEKMQPPPLVVTSKASKPQQTLVRLAPISSKTGQAAMQQARSGQSLLAPLSPAVEPKFTTRDDITELLRKRAEEEAIGDDVQRNDEYGLVCEQQEEGEEEEEDIEQIVVEEDEPDSKESLHALIADAVVEPRDPPDQEPEVEVGFQRRHISEQEDNDAMESEAPDAGHQLIVIPSYLKQDVIMQDDEPSRNDTSRNNDMINIEVEPCNEYLSPRTPQTLSENELASTELGLRPRKACNCTKSQCLKLYCDCFANGEFCNRCNCNNCHNNLENEELRQKAIRGCLDRNPNAFRPKIGKSKTGGPEIIRRHNKGCNCKRSGCLKNYCECYEAKIACTAICKCVGCRNVEETLERARRRDPATQREAARDALVRPPPLTQLKQPCSFMTSEVIEAVCQCLLAAAVDSGEQAAGEDAGSEDSGERDPVRDVIVEFARCLQDIISAAHQATPLGLCDETNA